MLYNIAGHNYVDLKIFLKNVWGQFMKLFISASGFCSMNELGLKVSYWPDLLGIKI